MRSIHYNELHQNIQHALYVCKSWNEDNDEGIKLYARNIAEREEGIANIQELSQINEKLSKIKGLLEQAFTLTETLHKFINTSRNVEIK